MDSVNIKSSLLPELEKRLRRLSIERLRVANDFVAYLEDRENSDASMELLKIAGFQDALRVASQQAEKGEVVKFEDIRRDV